MPTDASRIEDYNRARRSGLVRIAALSIRHASIPHASVRRASLSQRMPQTQTISLELTNDQESETIVLTFSGVCELKVDGLHPGGTCYLQILSIASYQLEDISYRVSNDEQDLELSFYCKDFEIRRLGDGQSSTLLVQ